jgi:hypothetical protein
MDDVPHHAPYTQRAKLSDFLYPKSRLYLSVHVSVAVARTAESKVPLKAKLNACVGKYRMTFVPASSWIQSRMDDGF